MFRVVALICSLSIPHDACNDRTAREVIQMGLVPMCGGIASAEHLASAATLLKSGEYSRFDCRREDEPAE